VLKNGMDCTTPDDKGKCMENIAILWTQPAEYP
jgi:hypothetical protein